MTDFFIILLTEVMSSFNPQKRKSYIVTQLKEKTLEIAMSRKVTANTSYYALF